jgi:hypothetical protein
MPFTKKPVARLALGLALLASGVQGQPAPDILVDIAPCVGIAADTARLACFDQLATTESEPVSVGEAEAATVASFGNQAPATSARLQTNPEGEQELVDEIVDMRERVPGRYIFTLASGQVWYQDNSQRMRLRKGMQVRIYPSPLGGSWRMARADGGQSGFVQVSRIE